MTWSGHGWRTVKVEDVSFGNVLRFAHHVVFDAPVYELEAIRTFNGLVEQARRKRYRRQFLRPMGRRPSVVWIYLYQGGIDYGALNLASYSACWIDPDLQEGDRPQLMKPGKAIGGYWFWVNPNRDAIRAAFEGKHQ